MGLAQSGDDTRGPVELRHPRNLDRRRQASGYATSFKTRPRPKPVKGSIAQKVGDYYASFMDQDGIEAKGLTPLADEMARISAITDKTSLSAYLGATLNTEVDGLTANADHVFGVWVNQSFRTRTTTSSTCCRAAWECPIATDYLDPSPKMADVARPVPGAHCGDPETGGRCRFGEPRRRGILSLEIRMAQAHAPDADAADVFKQNNPWKRADFDVKAPGMDWDAYFAIGRSCRAVGIHRLAAFGGDRHFRPGRQRGH